MATKKLRHYPSIRISNASFFTRSRNIKVKPENIGAIGNNSGGIRTIVPADAKPNNKTLLWM